MLHSTATSICLAQAYHTIRHRTSATPTGCHCARLLVGQLSCLASPGAGATQQASTSRRRRSRGPRQPPWPRATHVLPQPPLCGGSASRRRAYLKNHWAAFPGKAHVPCPPSALQALASHTGEVPQESGQQRCMSLGQLLQYSLLPLHVDRGPQCGLCCRHTSLSSAAQA